MSGAAALVGLAASPGMAGARSFLEDTERRVPIRNLWTGERRDLVYWREGDYDRHALDAYSYLFRDRRNGEVEPIFYGVLDQLFFLWKALERPARIDLVSGYRSARTNAWLRASGRGVARNSLHTVGMAADIRVPGIASEAVWRQAVDLRRGGVGLYRASDFVHIDVGPVRSWGFGERASSPSRQTASADVALPPERPGRPPASGEVLLPPERPDHLRRHGG
ncbi:MAG: DUF882 domain-containing protein [Rhodospirillales bacterium]|nr:DUF882 domain-containing protein [Rhodospirillales bacterium]MDE0380340.1 DUF882 domain-containing protein [Rhodospirillales bacterium]